MSLPGVIHTADEVFYKDQVGLAQSLPLSLDESAFLLQLLKQLTGFFISRSLNHA